MAVVRGLFVIVAIVGGLLVIVAFLGLHVERELAVEHGRGGLLVIGILRGLVGVGRLGSRLRRDGAVLLGTRARLRRALGLHLLGRDHGRGGRRDLAAVGVADEGNGHLRRVADLLNEALLIGRVVKHVLHLRDERLTGIVVGNQAKQAADFRHVTLSVDRWSPPRGSIAS